MRWLAILALALASARDTVVPGSRKKFPTLPGTDVRERRGEGGEGGRKAAWTVLFYVDADCDLEEDMMRDLEEIAAAKGSDRVNRVLLVDRAEEDEMAGYSGEDVGGIEAFTTAKRLVVEGGRFKELEDVGEVNMGEGKTLEAFLAWGVKAYPAERYAVILSNHGDGWTGFASDESHDDDMLNLGEISRGLKAAGATFDLIGFDGCVMATVEVAAAVRDHARVMVASEELEPGWGWNYTPWLTAMAEKPGAEAAAIAREICDSFKAFYDKSAEDEVKAEGKTITLSAVDLTKFGAVAEAVDALASKVAAKLTGREAWLAIARARHGSEEYGKMAGESNYLHDVHHLARLLKGHGFDAECDAIVKAVEAAVLHRVAGAYHPEARGLSIYFPPERDIYDDYNDPEKYAGPAKWTPMLEAYLKIEAADEEEPAVEDVKVAEEAVTATSTSDDVATASFVLGQPDGDGQLILGAVPVDVAADLKATFDGKWFMLSDDADEILAPVESYEKVDKDTWLAGIPVTYRPPGETDDYVVTLYYELKKESAEFAYAYEFNDFGATDIDIEEGGIIKPMYLVLLEGGEEEWREVDEKEALKAGAKGLGLARQEVPAGEYLVGFRLTDLAGNSKAELTKIDVKR